MIPFRNITTDQYEDLRQGMITKISGQPFGQLAVYLDQDQNPTIGHGMNLRAAHIFSEIMRNVFGIQSSGNDRQYWADIKETIHHSSYQNEMILRETLDSIMLMRANDQSITAPDKRSSFAFNSEEEEISAFQNVTNLYEADIDDWVPDIPFSY